MYYLMAANLAWRGVNKREGKCRRRSAGGSSMINIMRKTYSNNRLLRGDDAWGGVAVGVAVFRHSNIPP